jgi:pimeloyl-[acyl-carrier protein] synthase
MSEETLPARLEEITYDDLPLFNPFDPVTHADPYPAYRELRERDPVHSPFPGVWVLSRHRDVTALLRDARGSSDRRKSPLYDLFIQSLPVPPDAEALQPSMLFLDPPDHDRLRGLVHRAFTPRRVERLRERVQAVVGGLLDEARERGRFDIVADLGYPLPVTLICDILGVPEADRERMRRWSLDLIYTIDPIVPPENLARAQVAGIEFRGYLHELIADRRRHPGDDILSALVDAEDEGDVLTSAELVSTCVLLLVAGHETTSGLIGNGTLALLRHRDQLRRLHDDPSLIRGAIEELLRYDSPVQLSGRLALEDMEIDGRRIAPGEEVVMLLGSANRDPEQFDDPDALDIGRPENRHVAFGGGIHFCLGAHLARMEGGVAIGELARRFPTMELAADTVEWRDTITLRAPRSLPVTS